MSADDRVATTWRSDRLERDVKLVRWGSFGQPVLLFPTAGGDAEEIERFLMIKVLRPLLDAGKIKIYSCDSVAGRAMITREGSARHQMWIQNQFHQYIRHEVAPAIRKDCKNAEIPIWTAGASIGAFHAVAAVCRWPDVFTRAIAMSGTYDLRRFYDARPDEFDDHFFVSSPVHFVPTLSGPHLEALQKAFILLPSGEGRAEDIGESWRMAHVLGAKGIPNRVDPWGKHIPHDWMTWRDMLPKYLGEWTAG
jgi:esterase/lipase superfamily enzyme